MPHWDSDPGSDSRVTRRPGPSPASTKLQEHYYTSGTPRKQMIHLCHRTDRPQDKSHRPCDGFSSNRTSACCGWYWWRWWRPQGQQTGVSVVVVAADVMATAPRRQGASWSSVVWWEDGSCRSRLAEQRQRKGEVKLETERKDGR